jgi:hypothetical protein
MTRLRDDLPQAGDLRAGKVHGDILAALASR